MSFSVISAGLVAAAMILALCPIAQKIALVDRPNSRKAHFQNVPLVGGLAIYASFLAATCLLWPRFAPSGVFYVASAVLVVGGVLDDFLAVRARVKLAFQVSAIFVMAAAGGVTLQTLGEIIPGVPALSLGLLAIPFTLVVAVGVINAVNLSDGLDGLAGFQVLVAFAGLALLAERGGDAASFGALLILIACVIGFLFFNARILGRTKAAAFLGDAGTMFLGFAFVWFAIRLSSGPEPAMSPITALWLLAVPICDMVTMLIRRISRGRSPFMADKEHLHHVLMFAGFTVGETVMVLTAIAVAAAGIGIAGEVLGVPEAVMLGALLVAGGIYLYLMIRSWAVMRFLRWSINRRRVGTDRRTRSEQRKEQRGPPTESRERRSGIDRRREERRIRDLAAESAAQADGDKQGAIAPARQISADARRGR